MSDQSKVDQSSEVLSFSPQGYIDGLKNSAVASIGAIPSLSVALIPGLGILPLRPCCAAFVAEGYERVAHMADPATGLKPMGAYVRCGSCGKDALTTNTAALYWEDVSPESVDTFLAKYSMLAPLERFLMACEICGQLEHWDTPGA